jgi:hypothetical protein
VNVVCLADNRNVTGRPQSPSGVSETAFNVAQAWAEESQHPERLFDDPLAAAFVAARGKPRGEPTQSADAGICDRPCIHTSPSARAFSTTRYLKPLLRVFARSRSWALAWMLEPFACHGRSTRQRRCRTA